MRHASLLQLSPTHSYLLHILTYTNANPSPNRNPQTPTPTPTPQNKQYLLQSYESLHRATTQLSEALARPMPALAEDAFTRLGATAAAADASDGGAAGGGDYGASDHVFEDPEVRAFYEDLPDLRAVVPAILLADATAATSGGGAAAATSSGGAAAGSSGGGGGGGSVGGQQQSEGGGGGRAGDGAAKGSEGGEEEKEKEGGSSGGAAAAGGGGSSSVVEDRAAVDAILLRLNSCVTRWVWFGFGWLLGRLRAADGNGRWIGQNLLRLLCTVHPITNLSSRLNRAQNHPPPPYTPSKREQGPGR